jgi:hypothetical protein
VLERQPGHPQTDHQAAARTVHVSHPPPHLSPASERDGVRPPTAIARSALQPPRPPRSIRANEQPGTIPSCTRGLAIVTSRGVPCGDGGGVRGLMRPRAASRLVLRIDAVLWLLAAKTARWVGRSGARPSSRSRVAVRGVPRRPESDRAAQALRAGLDVVRESPSRYSLKRTRFYCDPAAVGGGVREGQVRLLERREGLQPASIGLSGPERGNAHALRSWLDRATRRRPGCAPRACLGGPLRPHCRNSRDGESAARASRVPWVLEAEPGCLV